MLAAKSQKLASGESSSSISVEQPEQTVEEHTTITSAGEQSCLEESLLLLRVYSSDEEEDNDAVSDFNIYWQYTYHFNRHNAMKRNILNLRMPGRLTHGRLYGH